MKTANIKVELLDHMGDDLTVVNAARVSMNREHEQFASWDGNLIAYLARNEHWSPFAHPQISFRITAPIFVARQLVKHHVGLSFNEVSRRYVDSEPEFYMPGLRERCPDVKQGSWRHEIPDAEKVASVVEDAYDYALTAYNHLLEKDVAPEVARAVLPVGMMTTWIWTGSLYAFIRVCKQRLGNHAQTESREVASGIAEHLRTLFPVSYCELMRDFNGGI